MNMSYQDFILFFYGISVQICCIFFFYAIFYHFCQPSLLLL